MLCLHDRVSLGFVSLMTMKGLPEGRAVYPGEGWGMPMAKGVFLGLSGQLTCPCRAPDF